uniref:vesicular inhibitory amino acid transporter-like n=1 Tax=Styela clava TaxID=7725 RepID=UPI00193A2DF3|nr:vesicular inhibitory amino acid transporter-like [Styela clava]
MFSSVKQAVSSDQVLMSLKRVVGRQGESFGKSSHVVSGQTNLTTGENLSNSSMSLSCSDPNFSTINLEGTDNRRQSCFSIPATKPKISSWDAGWNVTNSIQGMFVLGLPYAIMHGGYIGLLLIVLTAVICYYTGLILVECLYEKNEDEEIVRVRENYFDVAAACWGRHLATVVNIAQLIELLMTCVLYIVVSGNMLASSFPSAGIGEAGWSTFAMLILVPCIFLKNLRVVSKLSMGCTIAQAVVVVITLIYCLSKIQYWAWSKLTFTVNAKNFPVSIGVIVFSYTSQIFLPTLEGSMEYKGSFNKMLYWSYGASCGSKFIFALFCFLTWSHETKEVITDNLPHGLRVIISIVLVIKALLSYPLPYYASVETFEQSIFTGATGGLGSLFKTKAHPYDDLSGSESMDFPSNELEVQTPSQTRNIHTEKTSLKSKIVLDNSERRPGWLPSCYKPDGNLQMWAYGLRLLVVFATYLVALFIPHFALLMGLTGSLTGALLAFIFPSAFYLQLRWRMLSRRQILLNVSIVLVGFICGVSGIYHSIQGLYEAYHPVDNHVFIFNNSSFLNGSEITPNMFNATTISPMKDLILFNEPGPSPDID